MEVLLKISLESFGIVCHATTELLTTLYFHVLDVVNSQNPYVEESNGLKTTMPSVDMGLFGPKILGLQ